MSDQPEALRLIELFELESDPESQYRKAAAELRRLHQVELQRDELVALLAGSKKFVAFAYSKGIVEAEEVGLKIEALIEEKVKK